MNKTDQETPLYDATAKQTVTLDIVQNGVRHRPSYLFDAIGDDNFIAYMRKGEQIIRKMMEAKNSSLSVFQPEADFFDETVISRKGYKSDPKNWKEKMRWADKLKAMDTLTYAEVITPDEEDIVDADPDVLLDDGEPSLIELAVRFDGLQFLTKHTLREADTAHMDELVAIMEGKGQTKRKGQLASLTGNLSHLERTSRLYDDMVENFEGYKGDPPIWHKSAVALAHVMNEMNRMGKF